MKRSGSAIGVGGSSILVIFVLLCLTTFATLSLVSANADWRLTRRTADAATAYYEADAKAEELLAQVDGCLMAARGAGDYWSACERELARLEGVTASREDGALRVFYAVPITENRSLQVALRVPPQGGESRFELEQWKDVSVGEWLADDSITLWGGEGLS